MRTLYLSHPQVQVDPAIAVPQWRLSAPGRARAEAFVARGMVPVGAHVFSSTETKALELAALIATAAQTEVISDPQMGENDRSATGFLPPQLFEATADRFFAHPQASVDGWERAVDAQQRIVGAVASALARISDDRPVIFCGHGAVGTLLKCHVGQRAISRSEDQSRHGHSGGGNGFVFDLAAMRLGQDWTALEDLPLGWPG